MVGKNMKITPLRVVAISSAIGLVATWLGAANNTGTIVDDRLTEERVGSSTVVDLPVVLETESFMFRAQEQEALASAPTRITRNPFSLVRPERVTLEGREGGTIPNPSNNGTGSQSTSMAYELKVIGFAINRSPAGVNRTAIVELSGNTVLARQGDDLGNGLVVTEVGEKFVEVTDAAGQVFKVDLP